MLSTKIKKLYKTLNILKLLSRLCVMFSVIFLLFRVIMIFCYHNDIGGIEHNVIFSICNVIAGEPLYEDPQMGNFNITQYTPVYYFINLICCEIFNLNPLDNLFQIYIIGRSLSFLFKRLHCI